MKELEITRDEVFFLLPDFPNFVGFATGLSRLCLFLIDGMGYELFDWYEWLVFLEILEFEEDFLERTSITTDREA